MIPESEREKHQAMFAEQLNKAMKYRNMSVKELDTLTRDIASSIYSRFGVYLTIGVYASNTDDEQAREIMTAVRSEISDHAGILQMHGFYLRKEDRFVSFDLIVDFGEPDPGALIEHIRSELSEKYPDYTFRNDDFR